MPHETADVESSPDRQLIERTAAGERAAFHALVDRYQAALFRYARNTTRTRQDAEDVLQETFLAAFRSAGGFRGEASVKTWLFTIARNAAFQIRGASARVRKVDVDLATLGAQAGWGQDPEILLIRSQNKEILSRALAVLAPEDREILVLRDLEGLSGEDAAEVLGLGLPAMKSRLHRARLRLAGAVRSLATRADTPIKNIEGAIQYG